MRMFFLPEQAEEYEAGKDLLGRRFEAWARERGAVIDPDTVDWALDFRHHSVDGRLGFWTGKLVREFLLDWMPRRVSVTAAEAADVPETLRLLLRYLDHTGLLDPGGDPPAELETAITEAGAE